MGRSSHSRPFAAAAAASSSSSSAATASKSRAESDCASDDDLSGRSLKRFECEQPSLAGTGIANADCAVAAYLFFHSLLLQPKWRQQGGWAAFVAAVSKKLLEANAPYTSKLFVARASSLRSKIFEMHNNQDAGSSACMRGRRGSSHHRACVHCVEGRTSQRQTFIEQASGKKDQHDEDRRRIKEKERQREQWKPQAQQKLSQQSAVNPAARPEDKSIIRVELQDDQSVSSLLAKWIQVSRQLYRSVVLACVLAGLVAVSKWRVRHFALAGAPRLPRVTVSVALHRPHADRGGQRHVA